MHSAPRTSSSETRCLGARNLLPPRGVRPRAHRARLHVVPLARDRRCEEARAVTAQRSANRDCSRHHGVGIFRDSESGANNGNTTPVDDGDAHNGLEELTVVRCAAHARWRHWHCNCRKKRRVRHNAVQLHERGQLLRDLVKDCFRERGGAAALAHRDELNNVPRAAPLAPPDKAHVVAVELFHEVEVLNDNV